MGIWLKEHGVQDVCMESTGKYWIPVFNILKQNDMKPILTHPKYVKQAKGQKTNFRDAIHMASMFRMDLVAASYIPPADIRDLRELCRYRLKLTYMRTSEKKKTPTVRPFASPPWVPVGLCMALPPLRIDNITERKILLSYQTVFF